MEYKSCIAKRTRLQTDLFIETLFKKSNGQKARSIESNQFQSENEKITSGYGAFVETHNRKRKREKFEERVSEPEGVFVGMSGVEGGEEQGYSVSVSSRRSELKSRFDKGKNVVVDDEDDLCDVTEIYTSDESGDEEVDVWSDEVIVIDQSGGDVDENDGGSGSPHSDFRESEEKIDSSTSFSEEEEEDNTSGICEKNGATNDHGGTSTPNAHSRKNLKKNDDSSTNPYEEKKEEGETNEIHKENNDFKDEFNSVAVKKGEHNGESVGWKGGYSGSKRKRAGAPNNFDVFKLLVNAFREKSEVLQDDLDPSREEALEQETKPHAIANNEPLPLKFTFGIEEPKPVEKSEYGKEAEKLWAEMDFALKSSEMRTFTSRMIVHGRKNMKKIGSSKKPSEEDETNKICKENHDFKDQFNGVTAKKGERDETYVGRKEGYSGSKRKRACAPKDSDIFKLLANSIWAKGEVLQDDLGPSQQEAGEQETKSPANHEPLPLKFTFGIEEPKPVEKSKYGIEVENLWAEMDFALMSSEMGSFTSPVVDKEETNEPKSGTNPAALCRQGKHQFILDEEIGIICYYCSLVKLEIKDVLPNEATYPFEGTGRKISSNEGDIPMFDGLQFHASGSNAGESCNHTEGTVWDIIPGLKKSMYKHQQEGFEFIWKNLAGTTELDMLTNSDPNGVGGCIISHAPGTGKTRLTIAFLQTYLELFPECRPVIIAPASMLLTWEEEFRKWNVGIPFHNLNNLEFSGKENMAAISILERNRRQCRSKNPIRMVKLYSWSKTKSILGVSYSLYEKLAGEMSKLDKESKKKRKAKPNKGREEMGKILLELPGLLVLDEGHTPRNQRSCIWQLLSSVQTKKRIILSGTPFQNNFGELYNTLCIVRPAIANTIPSSLKKFCQKRLQIERKVSRKKWATLSSSSGKLADKRIEELRALMAPFAHVYKGSILQESLPGLRDCVVVLNPGDLQKGLIESIWGCQNALKFEHKLSLASVHPSLLLRCELEKEESSIDLDQLEGLKLNPNAGVKTRFLMEVIRLSIALNEKVLVFSQFIDPLSLIMDQLSSLFDWSEGKEVLWMHGKLYQKQRQSLINIFNDPGSEARILLASTKACSEGINLVGASRVILLDVVWNPSVETQAISRAYRLGQKRVVYTYHLIIQGTTECDKYWKQAEKDRLSELVFSSTNKESDKQKESAVVSEDKVLEEMIMHDKLKDMFEKIIYQPKESNLVETFVL